MAFELPPLPYDYDALEPHIDEQTMRLHHDKHHNTYVTNLNGAIEGTDLEIMSPNGGGEPVGDLADAINSSFGSFENLQEQWAAMSAPGSVFGSGWTWLVAAADGSLSVECTPNGDSPLMEGKTPVIGIDLWEHAYYLKYQNARPDYVSAWWNVVNGDEANRRFQAAQRA